MTYNSGLFSGTSRSAAPNGSSERMMDAASVDELPEIAHLKELVKRKKTSRLANVRIS